MNPRWQEPKIHIDPEQYYARYKPIEKPFTTRDVVDVPSRWQEPRPTWREPEPVRVPKTKSVLETPQYTVHKQFATSLGFGRAPSKYFDVGGIPDHEENKRLMLEEERQRRQATETRGEGPFRYKHLDKQTFAELMPKETKRVVSPARASSKSVVMEWVNKGVPIPGAENVLSAQLARKERSPTRRQATTSPERPWKAGRVDPKVPPKPTKIVEDKKVAAVAVNLKSARAASPPRVASLPIPARRTHEGLESPRAHMRPQYDAATVTSRLYRTTSGVSTTTNSPTRSQAANPMMASGKPPLRGTSPTTQRPFRSTSPTTRSLHTTVTSPVRRNTSPVRPQPALTPRMTTVSPHHNPGRVGSVSPTRSGQVARTYSPVPSSTAAHSDTSMNLPFSAMAPPSVVKSMRR